LDLGCRASVKILDGKKISYTRMRQKSDFPKRIAGIDSTYGAMAYGKLIF